MTIFTRGRRARPPRAGPPRARSRRSLRGRAAALAVGALGQVDAQLLELAVQVRALQAGLLGDPGHAAVLARQVMLEIGALERVARLAQRQVERQLADRRGGPADAGHRRSEEVRRWRGHRRRQRARADRQHRDARRAPGVRCERLVDLRRDLRRVLAAAPRQPLLDRLQQLLQRDRFLEEVERADARRLDRGVDRRVSGHHDHGHRQLAAGRPLLEQRHAVGVRHPDVEQHQVDRVVLAQLACLPSAVGKQHRVALVAEDLGQQFSNAHFVVNNQYFRHVFLLSSRTGCRTGRPAQHWPRVLCPCRNCRRFLPIW
jgi:hypothetical protein